MARRLVELLAPRPGERALDIGCGRGAVSLPLAEAVGPGGAVTAADLVPAMVEAVSDDALRLGRAQPEHDRDGRLGAGGAPGDLRPGRRGGRAVPAARPAGGARPAGCGCSSRAVGSVITTFGEQDPTWAAVDSLFVPYRPAGSLGPRITDEQGPFGGADDVNGLFVRCGAVDVRTVPSRSGWGWSTREQWRAFTMTTGQRQAWQRVPPDERDRLFRRARFLLESARDDSGHIVLTQQVRYTLGLARIVPPPLSAPHRS